MHRTAFAPALLQAVVTGALSDAEWRERVALDLAAYCSAAVASSAVTAWSAYPGEVDMQTLALLDRCSTQLQVVLVTNATSRLAEDLKTLGLDNRFFAVINSSEIGAAKPDSLIFRTALQRVAATANEALFVDDTAANVRAAAELGIEGHQFVDHGGLEQFLRRHGALADAALY